MSFQKNSYDRFRVEFGYRIAELRTTSSFGKSKNALAAINGRFFDMDNGGRVSYFEVNDTVIQSEWGVSITEISNFCLIQK